jgi:hypothetical protein
MSALVLTGLDMFGGTAIWRACIARTKETMMDIEQCAVSVDVLYAGVGNTRAMTAACNATVLEEEDIT